LIGAGKISLADYCNISSRVAIYSSSDDYSGETMTNPMVPEQYKAVQHAPVTLEKHVIVGCGSVILPGVTMLEGAAAGALSLVNRDCESFSIYAGQPARFIKPRQTGLIAFSHKLECDGNN
jgi:galactoside O-acetyltransferase